MHANAVYKYHHGEVPTGLVVHHKDGKHSEITDDRPENLMLLPDEWNLRFFPVLAKGYGVSESVVTDLYVEVFDKSLSKEELFSRLNEELIRKTRKGEQKC